MRTRNRVKVETLSTFKAKLYNEKSSCLRPVKIRRHRVRKTQEETSLIDQRTGEELMSHSAFAWIHKKRGFSFIEREGIRLGEKSEWEYPSEKTKVGTVVAAEEEESMVTGEDERERAAITESGGGVSGGKESLIPSIFLFLCVCEMRGGDKTD